MTQQAFHIILKPGTAARYKELHSPVPDAITQQLTKAGIYDFSIFLDGNHIFGVMRYSDEERIKQNLTNDVSPAWTKAIIDITIQRRVDHELPLLKRLEQVFRFEGEIDGALN
jgi:L-rhamnose mutarotase